jgi:hypothetical protein
MNWPHVLAAGAGIWIGLSIVAALGWWYWRTHGGRLYP